MDRKPRRKEVVSGDERRKAEFLSEYAALCRKHNMMVVAIAQEDDTFSHPYVAMEFLGTFPGAIDHIVQEMLVHDLWEAEAPEHPST